VAIIFAAAVVVATFNPASARADVVDEFQSPTGDVYCQMAVNNGVAAVACEGGGPYAAPKPACAAHLAWGDRFVLTQGEAPVSHCHGDTIRTNPPVPILDYGQTRTVGDITCDNEPSDVTCTDAGTGHFFTMSAISNTLG